MPTDRARLQYNNYLYISTARQDNNAKCLHQVKISVKNSAPQDSFTISLLKIISQSHKILLASKDGSGAVSGRISAGFGSRGFGFGDNFPPTVFGFGFGFGFPPVDIQ